MLKEAKCAIVVIGDADKQDVWVEDCSVAMTNMHLMADHLGLGSCWIQGRLRKADADTTAEEYVRARLGFPEKLQTPGYPVSWYACCKTGRLTSLTSCRWRWYTTRSSKDGRKESFSDVKSAIDIKTKDSCLHDRMWRLSFVF